MDGGATNNRSAYAQDSNNYSGDRGKGDYDIRNRFTLSLSYDLPSFKLRCRWERLADHEHREPPERRALQLLRFLR